MAANSADWPNSLCYDDVTWFTKSRRIVTKDRCLLQAPGHEFVGLARLEYPDQMDADKAVA